MDDVMRILSAINRGEPQAAKQLLPLVYDELRKLATLRLAQERPGQTLQPTALVHEAYIRLVREGEGPRWDDRSHFFAAASEAMRRILVDIARRKATDKRGGRLVRQELNDVCADFVVVDPNLLAIDEALERLAARNSKAAQLVKLRYFAGLSVCEAAGVMGISESTAGRLWEYARAFIKDYTDL